MPEQSIRLIAGLGNPGSRYVDTRHNAGFWMLNQAARQHGGQFRSEARFHADGCKIRIRGEELWLIKPLTWMNRSGLALRAFVDFYKLSPEAVLVVHDEIDLSPGTIRFKLDGGHGGHNGLRDIHAHLGSNRYRRLRIGVGHPGSREDVVGYVLTRPPATERAQIEEAIDAALTELPTIVSGEFGCAMNALHSR